MALSARPIGVPSGPNVASGHMPAGGRNVTSATYAPIEEINTKVDVFADPNYNFQGFTQWMKERRPEVPQPPSNPSNNFDTTSTTFLHLLVQQQRDADPNTVGKTKDGPGFQAVLNKAIRAYETTAEVIGNAPPHLGASFSASY